MSSNAAEWCSAVVERVMQEYSKYYSEEMKFTCAVSSIAFFNAKDRLIWHAVDYFLVPREFKSVVLSCKPIHHVSLCQLRFFATECLFNTIVSLSTLSSGLSTLISFSYKVCWWNKSCNDDSAFLSNGNGYKRNASNTCTVASISSIPGVTSTNVRSFGVRADSIHVTRVISFTLVNIWKTIDKFLHLIVFITYSRLIPLIITNYKTNVSLLRLHD